MRVALEEAWPILSREYGLHPWDVGRLTLDELNVYLDDFRHRAAEASRARREARRGR